MIKVFIKIYRYMNSNDKFGDTCTLLFLYFDNIINILYMYCGL